MLSGIIVFAMIVPDHRRATLNPPDATSGGFPFHRLAVIIDVQRRSLVYRRCVSLPPSGGIIRRREQRKGAIMPFPKFGQVVKRLVVPSPTPPSKGQPIIKRDTD